MFWIDQYYILLVLPTVILALYAQAKVNSTFNRYRQERRRQEGGNRIFHYGQKREQP